MEQKYHLSAGALLYAVRLLRKRGFYGVPNAMPKLSDSAFPAFAQDAEMELIESGCGILNFDGEFSLETGFADLLGRCADCTEVIGAMLCNSGEWHRLTAYPSAHALLERPKELQCVLSAAAQPVQALLDQIRLREMVKPELSKPLCEVLVSTEHLEKRNLTGLLNAGCSRAMAEMVLTALDGRGCHAHVSRATRQERIEELVLLYGAEGILNATVEYTDQQEMMRLTPVTVGEAEALLAALAGTEKEADAQ